MRLGAAGLAVALALGQAAPALAEADDGMCRNGMFAEENASFGMARITGPGKARFFKDMDGCPRLSDACMDRAYVVPGDRVVTGRIRGQFTCAYFPNDVGGTAGWMPTARLAALPGDPAPPVAAWLGRWADVDNTVRFSAKGGRLFVQGNAYWPSASGGGGYDVHLGEIDGPVEVRGSRAFNSACKVSFHLLGPVMVVADPARECDGMNVAFTGVYRRQRH